MHPGCYSLPANWSEAYRPRIKSASWIRKVNILKNFFDWSNQPHSLLLPYHNRRRDRWLPFSESTSSTLLPAPCKTLKSRGICKDIIHFCSEDQSALIPLETVLIHTYDQLTEGPLSQSFVSQKKSISYFAVYVGGYIEEADRLP